MGSISHVRHTRATAERPRDRLAQYLMARCGTPKALAREIGASPKQAENVLAGHWPSDLTWAAIVRRFGEDVWRGVWVPEIAPELAALHDEERRLDERLEAARARRRQMEGGSGGLASAAGAPAAAAGAEALEGRRRAA